LRTSVLVTPLTDFLRDGYRLSAPKRLAALLPDPNP